MQIRNWLVLLLIAAWVAFGSASSSSAQDPSGQQPPADPSSKEKATPEEKAVTLLEQVISEAQSLRLPENRIRVGIAAGDLLWDRNESRARALFAEAAAGLTEMMRNVDGNDRQNFMQTRTPTQLRQELLLTVARHDSALAYQLLQSTRPPEPPPAPRNGRRPDTEANLEQNLLAQIAAHDPKLALQNAEQMLDKGQYSGTLARVLQQLQRSDKDAAASFADRLLKRLQSENLLANRDAGSLAMSLLQPGPRPAAAPADAQAAPANNPAQVLSESAFKDLMETVIAAALKAQPTPPGNNRGANNPRGGPNGGRGGPNNTQTQSPPTDAQIEQATARGLLMGLQGLLPQIDQFLPSRASAVRQKLAELGVGTDPRLAFGQINNLMQQGTTDSLMAAASAAPPGMQTRLYQEAALKAIDEGQADRGRQIANEHLDPATRASVLQSADFQQMARNVSADKLDEVRQTLARLGSDEDRVKLLLQLAAASQKDNAKLSLQFLDEARGLANRRATSYQQFDTQLKVARATAALDPARSLETLEPGIRQLNELLSAASLLSGFEVNVFKDGELPLQGGTMLANMVSRYAQELAGLAKADFEHAQATAEKFQLSEPRILARLAIVRGVLGVPPLGPVDNGFGGRGFGGFGPNGPFMRRQQ